MEYQKKGAEKSRISVLLTGVASDFVNHIPFKNKGIVLSLVISHALYKGYIKEALSPLFTEEQVNEFVGTLRSSAQKLEVSISSESKDNADDGSGSHEKLKKVQEMWREKP